MISSIQPPMSASPRPNYENMPASPSCQAYQQQQSITAISCSLPYYKYFFIIYNIYLNIACHNFIHNLLVSQKNCYGQTTKKTYI
jgi:hypothetical protein